MEIAEANAKFGMVEHRVLVTHSDGGGVQAILPSEVSDDQERISEIVAKTACVQRDEQGRLFRMVKDSHGQWWFLYLADGRAVPREASAPAGATVH
ncbi:MAG: hypothetical protein MK186_14350 [Henriciella sp.]|nr:hypothetical protein [Henriciella sp.]